MSDKVLCVDDEPKLLAALHRHLGEQFELHTAVGGEEGLATLASKGPFAVIVSDMRMPGMDGSQFLAAAKQRAPDSTRIMLTGCADQETAIAAVNEGNIFRFLTKPCAPDALAQALRAGIEQHRLVVAEKELLERTLSGSIKVLTDILSMVNPAAFGRAARVRRLARDIASTLDVDKPWAVDLAAMLCQIGCVTLPPGIMDKLYTGRPLARDEAEMLAAHPAIGRGLVAHIPRLELVADIIGHQDARFDGDGDAAHTAAGEELPIGARILKAALDYDVLTTSGQSNADALRTMRGRAGWYDPAVLDRLEAVAGIEEKYETREVRVQDLSGHMILAEDVRTVTGVLVVCKGHEVTQALRERIRNYGRRIAIQEPIRVLVKPERDLVATA